MKFRLCPLEGGTDEQPKLLDELFVLNCEGSEYPLGFEFTAQVKGLSVEFSKVDEEKTIVDLNSSGLGELLGASLKGKRSSTSHHSSIVGTRTGEKNLPVV